MVVVTVLLLVVAQAATVGSATLVMVAVVLSLIVGLVVVVPVICFLSSNVSRAESVVTRCLEFKISWLVKRRKKNYPGPKCRCFSPHSSFHSRSDVCSIFWGRFVVIYKLQKLNTSVT